MAYSPVKFDELENNKLYYILKDGVYQGLGSLTGKDPMNDWPVVGKLKRVKLEFHNRDYDGLILNFGEQSETLKIVEDNAIVDAPEYTVYKKDAMLGGARRKSRRNHRNRRSRRRISRRRR